MASASMEAYPGGFGSDVGSPTRNMHTNASMESLSPAPRRGGGLNRQRYESTPNL